MIVLDASATVELLLGTPAGTTVAARVRAASSLHAPHLLDLEVLSVLRRLVRAGQVKAAEAGRALVDLRDLGIERYGHEELAGRIWTLRDALTSYDAAYVILAEALDAELWTTDARLAAARGHRARIRLAA